ncbi:hypothetical protein ACN2MM_08490 [Alkalilimnicola ehrlichii MLHE-1]|uniref:Uncharacterized protein n=1 Tax=Alkalilimnicola ehrlichii (strain ATCC BAA-1101 / DSM 17681 / MLHE-1) TaxID=187272 RepID=Q0A8D6_ALKEH|nr:hypothetical protein [Alkalilimnicola ehrlichii]ABI56901.1 hypothetical protein Mlg_1554 [Alkalilimnicola ehrlichii MLHE-1]
MDEEKNEPAREKDTGRVLACGLAPMLLCLLAVSALAGLVIGVLALGNLTAAGIALGVTTLVIAGLLRDWLMPLFSALSQGAFAWSVYMAIRQGELVFSGLRMTDGLTLAGTGLLFSAFLMALILLFSRGVNRKFLFYWSLMIPPLLLFSPLSVGLLALAGLLIMAGRVGGDLRPVEQCAAVIHRIRRTGWTRETLIAAGRTPRGE